MFLTSRTSPSSRRCHPMTTIRTDQNYGHKGCQQSFYHNHCLTVSVSTNTNCPSLCQLLFLCTTRNYTQATVGSPHRTGTKPVLICCHKYLVYTKHVPTSLTILTLANSTRLETVFNKERQVANDKSGLFLIKS